MNLPIFNTVSLLEVALFTKHLSVMLKSGVPLSEALGILKQQTTNLYFRSVLDKVLADVANGQTLEKALSKFPKVFDPFYLSITGIGEQSGKLEENLAYLAQQLRKNYEFQKKVQGALLYPGLIVGTTLIVGGGLATFVLPQLVDLFKSLEVKLPLSTQILLFLAQIMKSYGLIITPAVFLAVLGIIFLLQTPFVKPWWHRTLLRMPIFGKFFLDIELSSFCRNLGIMLKGGIPIDKALDSLHRATSNLVFKDFSGRLQKEVDKGKKLSEEMSLPRFNFVPALIPKMVEVGENSGKLADTFIYLSEFFEEEVDNSAKNLSTILEPVLLLIIGLGVGFVAIAIISPIYQLTQGIHK